MKQIPVTGGVRDIGSRGIKDINKQIIRMSREKRGEIFRVIGAMDDGRHGPKHTGSGQEAWYSGDLEEAVAVKTVVRMGSERGE